jgi:steroid 5-alpha reductase family enzyme
VRKIQTPSGFFFFNFQFQALLILAVGFPLLISTNQEPTLISALFMIACLMAILFESIADIQLHQFKKEQPSVVCNKGLWALSRHPNYFFEVVFWFSFTLMSIGTMGERYFLLSPLLLFLIMHYITIPLTEQQSLKSKTKM